MAESKFGVSVAGMALAFLAVFIGVLVQIAPEFLQGALRVLFILAPVWLPILLALIFWRLWIKYLRMRFIHTQKYSVLEIRIPREIRKSPLAMEAVLSGLHISIGETTFVARNFEGKVRTWYSFELVSIDGNIHFFIWTRDFFKELIKSQIYAQYPEAEVHEVEDYTKAVPFDLARYSYWGCDFKLNEPDPYPIKTYIDYGLDNPAAKEEEKTNPLASVIEFLGSLPKGHQVWLQILAQTHKGPKKWPWSKRHGVKEQAEAIVEGILKKSSERTQKITGPDEDEHGMRTMTLTEGEREKIKALDRSVSKLAFDAGVRGIYLAEKDKFNPIFLVGLLGVWKQFGSAHLNGFTITRYMAAFDYPWQDFRQIRQNRAKRHIYEAYRLRSWFHEPYKTPSYVLNTEELATIFHFPGEVVKTPTAPRIPSRRAEPPANLPT